ncbi:hypothetical protein Prudu_008856 [Prunus dulcis]|uniref:Ankyrin repeat family protein n=1 Tax=Prunus dulcis TaxID=3755 RepID=A0A4Y1R5G2_PRUDU|nr:hypothetical protein Prudu_008856 [Prunus dulcis]
MYLIRRRRAVMTMQSSEPLAQPTSVTTAPALMDHLAVGPTRSQAPASSASSVAQPVSARWRHRPASTTDTTSTDASGPCRQLKTAKVTRVTNSRINIGYGERHRAAPMAELHSSLAHDIGHVVQSHCPMKWKSWKVMSDEIKMEVRGQLSTNYNLEDLDDESLAYVNRLFSERCDDLQIALQEGCPKKLQGREDSWAWLCAHFRRPLLWPFSYRMDVRRQTTMVERSQLVLQESASQLPPDTPIEYVDPPQDAGFQILTETLDQTLRRRPGTYCRGMGNARRREPRPRSSA